MAYTSGSYALPNPSVINTTPNPVYLPLSPVISCKVHAVTARYTATGNNQCFPMDFSAPPYTSTLYRLDEAMEVIPASPTRSGESSGIGGSAGLFECLPGVVEPSRSVSTTSSLNSECRYVQSTHIPACSGRPGTPRADESNRAGFMTSDNNHFCSNLLPNGSPPNLPIRNLRHQSLPTDSPIPICAKYNGPRRQSSPGAQRIGEPFSSPLPPTPPVTSAAVAITATTARNTSLTSSFNKLNIRSRCRGTNGVVVDMLARSVPGTVHAIPSSLEPIPQGQELLVNTAGLSGPISPTSPGGNVGARQPCKRVSDPTQISGSGTRRKISPCCACHFVSETLHHVEARVHLEAADARAAYASRLYKFNHSSVEEDPPDCDRDTVNGKSDSRNSGKHGAQWARDLLGRLRSNSTHLNTDQADLRSATPNGRKHVAVRPGDPNRSIETLPNGSNLPDTIDPRRLPKIHGPASACLQFSRKPLNSPVTNHTLPSSSQPIPMLNIHGAHISPVLKASSWRHRKQLHRVRWLSQSHGEESGCESSDGFFGTSSTYARLSCSAVEEFQGAVDILTAANRQQVFASSVCSARAAVRIRRASESERLLVISKSHSDSKEESVSCSFGQFDEDHVFSTLFRHSTCYDVLPDSGKLVMVDSRLGAVRAIRVLLENGVQAAPIWHAPTHSVTGLFSQELALHLLASLYSSITLADSSNQDAGSGDSGTPAKSAVAHNLLTDGLRMWGTRRLCEVLRVFHTEHDHGMCLLDPFDVDVIVSPQTRLRKALSRLLHRKSKLNSYASPQRSAFQDALSQRNQQPVQHHPADCNSDAAECCFSMDEANSSNGMKHHQPLQQVASTPVVVRSLSDSTKASSHFPIAANDIFSPTHLMVVDPTSGNVLGILGPDRLLAYLRLRLDELPYSTQMLSPVDSIPGLRWSERSWSLKHCRIKHNSSDPHPAADLNANLPSPILSPSSLCGDAIRALSIWLPQLPALPVICSNEGATTQTNLLLGFISPGDLLNFVLGHSPDQAVHQPVSKILEAKLMHCRFHQDCICYTHDLIADALDRTFRLKAPCLVLFDAPKHGTPAATGNPIGVVTSKDLLRAIVTSKSNRPDSGVAGMSHTNHERCDSPLGDQHWVGGSLSSDEVMSSNSFERNARKPEAIHHSDSLLGASNSSFDDGASLSSSSGSTCSAHSDSERMHLTSRLHHAIPSDGSFCNCACHQSMDGKNPPNGKNEQPRLLPSHQISTDSTFSCSSKGSEGPPTRTANVCAIDTKLPSPDAPTQFHPTVQQRSIRTPNTSTFHPVDTHSTPRVPGSALPTRDATGYPVTGLTPDTDEKKHVKRGDEEEAVFPMD